MEIELLLPARGRTPMEQIRELLDRGSGMPPFHPSILNAAGDLSRRLFRSAAARQYPELQALAFWIRAAELQRLAKNFAALEGDDHMLVPRGLVFHLPPRNVDTMFVYSWLLAALTGNRNIIRLSPERSESTDILLDLFREALQAAAQPARDATVVVSYGHDQEPTALISTLCDVRVIWGGDQTVATIRRSPLPPHAREIAFPDRYSMCAIRSRAYLELSGPGRDRVAEDFFNDGFWFHQLACSSPRLVIWCGDESESAEASRDLFARVEAYRLRRDFSLPAAATMQKLVFSCGAILDLPVTECRRYNGVTVLTLASLEGFRRNHPGGGLFFETTVARLEDIAPSVERRDQTLSWFGFGPEELRRLVRGLNSRAMDRLVPVGQALQFHRFWDGHDLLQEFCRYVHIGSSENLRPAAAQEAALG